MNKRSAEETKGHILDAARTVFAEHGYAEASMRLIAQTAGISVGALYLYFRNKEELYLTFTQDWMDSLRKRTREALRKPVDPVAAITAFINISIDFTRQHKETIILQGRDLGFSFGGDIKREFSRERQKIIADIIREGIEKEIFLECDAEGTARVIFNMLRGFFVSLVIDEGSLFAPADCVNMVLHGLLRRNNG
jgi:AcrR family transcriptional regulator